MAKFTKYNNPNRRKKVRRKSSYSQDYINEQKEEMYRLLAQAETEEEHNNIVKAFNVTIIP